jgi:hypothetical protein
MLNLEQFDLDVWKTMLKTHQRSPELIPDVAQQQGGFRFCHQKMRRIFSVDGVICGPHTVTGNRMQRGTVTDVLRSLFGWDDQE